MAMFWMMYENWIQYYCALTTDRNSILSWKFFEIEGVPNIPGI